MPSSDIGWLTFRMISMGAGGFHISFPIQQGDIGWIYAADRDTSQFLESLSMSKPNTGRIHKLDHGMFIPDVFRRYTIDS
ncbi:baseplate spike protein [Pseudomonas phage WP1]